MFVAFAPDFKDDKLTDEVHTGAAFTAFAASQAWVGLNNPEALLMWIPFGIYSMVQLIKKKSIKKFINESNFKFWGELTTLGTIYKTIL